MLEQIVNLINSERVKRGMNKVELARRAGISFRQFQNIEKGENTTVKNLESLLRALDVKTVKLVLK